MTVFGRRIYTPEFSFAVSSTAAAVGSRENQTMSTAPDTQPDEQPEADLSALIEPIRPYLDKYGSTVILGLAGILIVVAGWTYFSRSAKAEKARGWDKIIETNSSTAPEDFGDIAEDNPGTTAAEWALLRQAEGFLKRGIQSAFSNRKESTASYEKCREALNRLLNKQGTSVLVRERALYTMALLTESDSGADTADAIKAYEQLKSEFAQSVYVEEADDRIAALKDPKVQQFYGWFKDQNPSIADPLGVPNDPFGTTPPTPEAPLLPGGVGDPEPPGTPGEGEGESAGNAVPGTGSEEKPADEGEDGSDAASSAESTDGAAESTEAKPADEPKGDGSDDK